MTTFRQRALDEAALHGNGRYYAEEGPVSKYFGQNVLDLDKMRGYMSQQAYDVCCGEKQLLLVEGAGHGVSFVKDHETYSEMIYEFLKKNLEDFT